MLWPIAFGLIAILPLCVAFETAMHFTGVAIDGPFQLYNAMRRIAGGFRPGVDFQFFHGLGLAYLHYGLFLLFGGGFAGSELGRQLLSAVTYPFVLLAVFRLYTGEWRRSWALAAMGLACSLALHLSNVMFATNGMLGLRSALPTVIPAIVFAWRGRRGRAAIAGCLLGLALFLSTEQGLAALAAYTLVALVSAVRGPERRRRVAELAVTVGIAPVTLLLLLVLVGGFAGARGALRYNFVLVPRDQYWYFGSPPNGFIPSIGEGLRMLVRYRRVGLSILLGVTALAVHGRRWWRAAAGEAEHRERSILLLVTYGLVSCASLLGTFAVVYTQPLQRVLVIVALLELARWSDARAPRRDARWRGIPRTLAAAVPVSVVWMTISLPATIGTYFVSLPHIIRAHVVGGLGFSALGIWQQTLHDGQRIVDAHRGPRGEPPTMWSTYAGWLEARNGIYHPSFDYIIHALGPTNRQAYVDRFRSVQPVLVQTVRPTYTQYEMWIENTSWDLYADILRSYTVAGMTPWSIFWERRAEPGPAPQLVGTLSLPPGARAVPLPPVASTAQPTVLDVELTYRVQNPLRRLPIVGAIPRYLVEQRGALTHNPVSLDPYTTSARFPVVVSAGQRASLAFETYSLLPGASFEVSAIRVSIVPIDPRNLPWLQDVIAQEAGRGVARN